MVDLLLGLPAKLVGRWTIDQLAVVPFRFGWGLLSFFAIPTIAITGASAWAAARHSVRLVRGHWGDAVSGTVYLWVRIALLLGVPAAVVGAIGVLLLRRGSEFFGAVFFVAGVAGIALAYLLAQTARAVLTVVLYRFAETGSVHRAFPPELLERGVRGPSRLTRRLIGRIEGERMRRIQRRLLGDIDDDGRHDG